MDLTLVRSTTQRKNPRLVIFNIEGRPGSVQFFRALFPKDAIPTKLSLSGEFAAPKVKETPAERKARFAAITPAERLAKMEARVAKMKAKLAAEQAAPAPTPTPAPTPALKVAEAHRAKGKK
jgi:hypothetical protein